MKKYIVGITGASGSIYAFRLLEELLKSGNEVHLVISEYGKQVLVYEIGYDEIKLVNHLKEISNHIKSYDVDDMFAPIASGSFKTDGMVILPCSMSTISEISMGASKTLLGRAADVCIKERRQLILVPRETPLSTIHLKNMVSLSENGVIILPAMPAFYQMPKTLDDLVDFMVGKVLDSLKIDNDLLKKWGN